MARAKLYSMRASSLIDDEVVITHEGLADGILCNLRGPVSMVGYAADGNGYSKECWDMAHKGGYARNQIDNGAFWGELDHPPERDDVFVKFVSHRVNDFWLEGEKVCADIDVIDNEHGRQIYSLLRLKGAKVGISVRALGVYEKGTKDIKAESFILIAFDFVGNPGFSQCRLSMKEHTKESVRKAASGEVEFIKNITNGNEHYVRLRQSLDIDESLSESLYIGLEGEEKYKVAMRELCHAAGIKPTDDPDLALDLLEGRRKRASGELKGERMRGVEVVLREEEVSEKGEECKEYVDTMRRLNWGKDDK